MSRQQNRAGRPNPIYGTHPDLFGGETPMYVAIADIPLDQLVRLPRKAFTDREWDALDEDVQDQIAENDPESQARVDALADLFVQYYKWEQDHSHRDFSNIEESLEQWLADRARQGDFWKEMPRRQYRALVNYAEGPDIGLSESDVDEAINSVMEDQNNYQMNDDSGDVLYREAIQGSVYIDSSEWRELVADMTRDEVERAIAQIEEGTDNELSPDLELFIQTGPSQRRYGRDFSHDWDTGEVFNVSVDWDTIVSLVEEILRTTAEERGGGAEQKYQELEAKPPEERVVFRWPDGFFVQDLLAEELATEGKAMGICVGQPSMGYDKAIRKGEIKIYSLRRPSGKPLFTMEMTLDDEGNIAGVNQVVGKANRFPGFDLGKVGPSYPIKRDEIERIYQFVEREDGLQADLAVDDIHLGPAHVRDVDPKSAIKQVNKLYHEGDPWAVKLLTSLGIEPQRPAHIAPTVSQSELEEENPRRKPASCGLHGEGCSGFCVPYRRRNPRRQQRLRR